MLCYSVFIKFCTSIYPCFSLGKYIQYKVAAFVKSHFCLTSDNNRKQVDDRELASAKQRTSGEKRSTPKKDGRYRDTWIGGLIYEEVETLFVVNSLSLKLANKQPVIGCLVANFERRELQRLEQRNKRLCE